MKRVGLMVVAFAAMLGTAQAQTVVQGADTTEYQKITVIKFDDVNLKGELVGPECGCPGPARVRSAKFPPLIKYRVSFNYELQKSQDQL